MNFLLTGILGKGHYFVIMALVVAIDRLTKVWALTTCLTYRALMPGLSCELVFNKGISWGMLQADSRLSQIALTCALISIIVFLLYYTYKRFERGLTIVGEVLVIAGSLSNIADRLLYGAVVDFIHIGYHGLEFPTFFNIADAAIVLGVLMMLKSTKGFCASADV